MATRIKTIEYALPMLGRDNTGIIEGTTYVDSADMTLFVESGGRTFRNVSIELICHDSFLNNADPQAWGIRGSCNAGVTWTSVVKAVNLLTEGDEIITHMMTADMTAEFTARFTGDSNTFRYGFYIDYDIIGVSLFNVTAKLTITYEISDTNDLKLKTVRIPLESFTAAGNNRLTNAAQIVKQPTTSGSQLPALLSASTPFLPEGGITIRQAFIELWTNTMPSAITNSNLICKIDAGGEETTFGLHTGAAQTPYILRVFLDVTALDWTAAHDLYARHSAAAGNYFTDLGGMLIVTYEYTESLTARVLNSLMMGFGEIPSQVGLLANKERLEFSRQIAEGNPTLKQSGVWIMGNTGVTTTTLSVRFDNAAVLPILPTSAAGQSGQLSHFKRIDAGGALTSGTAFLSISGSIAAMALELYATNANYVSNVSVSLILNYESDKHAQGSDAHNHSVYYLLRSNALANAAAFTLITPILTPIIPETDHFITGVMPVLLSNLWLGTVYYLVLEASKGTTGTGWEAILSSTGIGSGERMSNRDIGSARFFFKRYSSDPDSSRVDIKTPRLWRINGVAAQVSLGLWVTHHSMTCQVSGTLTGYTGNGSGVTVEFFRDDNKEFIGSSVTTTGGNFTFTWYNPNIPIVASAKQGPNLAGRSYANLV